MSAETHLQERLQAGEVSIGQAVREIRQKWLRLHLDEYAKMVGVSKNTLAAVERDEEAASIRNLNKILRPLGYELTLHPVKAQPRRRGRESS